MLMLQAAAEYIGVMLSNGIRAVEMAAQDVGRWLGDHPVEIGAAVLAAFILSKLLRR